MHQGSLPNSLAASKSMLTFIVSGEQRGPRLYGSVPQAFGRNRHLMEVALQGRFVSSHPKGPSGTKNTTESDSARALKSATTTAKRYRKCSKLLVFLGKRGRETVQIVKNYGGIAKHYGFERRSIFSTEGSFGMESQARSSKRALRELQNCMEAARNPPTLLPTLRQPYSIPNMTGRPGCWTMEVNGGSSASHLARTPLRPLVLYFV